MIYYFNLNIKDVFVRKASHRVLSCFRGGGIAYLIDPDNYAGWSFYTLGKQSQTGWRL